MQPSPAIGTTNEKDDVGYSSRGSIGSTGRLQSFHSKECTPNDAELVTYETAINDFLEELTNGSPFFKMNRAPPLPMFDRKEVSIMQQLGQGEFGTVREVIRLTNESESSALETFLRANHFSGNNSSTGLSQIGSIKRRSMSRRNKYQGPEEIIDENIHADIEELTEATTLCTGESSKSLKATVAEEFNQKRNVLSSRCWREGRARYAVKRLREDLKGDGAFYGALDLAAEATFLASLSHPNIIKIRATVGHHSDPKFMMIMDRLYLTGEDQIQYWADEAKCERRANSNVAQRMFPILGNKKAPPENLIERVLAAFDVARALRYLHKNKIIYRDLKPANIGFDIRGDVRLFDFGLARELRPEDLVKAPDDYNCTGLTGSRRWMAPEVVRCDDYGFSADVYSFGIFFWQLASLKIPFGKIDCDGHYRRVVEKGERPKDLKFMPEELTRLMKLCWMTDRSKRPNFDMICQKLQTEILKMKQNYFSSSKSKLSHRSSYLRSKSAKSISALNAQLSMRLSRSLHEGSNHSV